MKRLDERLSGTRGAWLVLAFALLVRLPGMFLGVEHYGDAPVRIEVAERWLAHPHLWRGFTESYQYGPLHLTLIALAMKLVPSRHLAPQLLSLLCGLASIGLLMRLTRRLFTRDAALFAGFSLSLYTVHLQASTTGASETVFLTLLLAATDLWFDGRGVVVPSEFKPDLTTSRRKPFALQPLLWSGVLLGASALVRYDSLLLAPLFGLVLLWDLRKSPARGVDLTLAVLWGAFVALPSLGWFALNHIYAHDALAPLHFIEGDHQNLAALGTSWFGPIGYRLYCLVFWPSRMIGMATLAGVFALIGAWRVLLRRSRGWELALIAWAPPVYFTFRAAVLANFRPLSRFVLTAATLSLPFAWDALVACARWAASSKAGRRLLDSGNDLDRRTHTFVRILVGASAVLLLAGPAWLFAVSYRQVSNLAEWARPISPVSSVPPGIEDAARWLRENARPDDVLVVDGVWNYLEIPLVFASDLPESRVIRRAYDNFDAKLAQTPPTLAVTIYQGNLRFTPGVTGLDTRPMPEAIEAADRFTLRGVEFCAAQKWVFVSVYRRCL